MRRHLAIELYFAKGYIAHPYWPEREEVINIQKISGMNRVRNEEKRQNALATYLKKMGWDEEMYAELVAKAERAWYRLDNDDETSCIIIPSHQMYGCLISAADLCPATLRPCPMENLRHCITLSDFVTEKTQEDGVYKRLVMPKSGQGASLSNQRSLRSNPVIIDFTAKGTIEFWTEDVRDNGDFMEEFLDYAGSRIGVGAARKMGYGRFEVTTYSQQKD